MELEIATRLDSEAAHFIDSYPCMFTKSAVEHFLTPSTTITTQPVEPMATPSPSGPADPTTAPQQQQQQPTPAPTSQPPPPQEPAAAAAAAAAVGPPPPPASPPLPTRHTAVTPGARAKALQDVFDGALARTLARLEWDNFAACYPTVAARAPNSLRSVQQRVVSLLRDKCRNEFRIILDERHVVARLNELESLASDAARRKAEAEAVAGGGGGGAAEPGVPPHLLPPDDVLAAHLAPHLASQQSQLNARLQTSQSRNAALFDEIQAQRREAAALLAQLEAVVGDISGANEALLAAGAADELARETRAVEAEMGGT
ncbi:hypothetical protein RB595_000532 [Gaeumannomyces hyphopodioides]